MKTSQFFGLVVFVICATYVHSLKCFQCNSADDPECATISKNQTDSPYYKVCNETMQGHKTFCRKTVIDILDAKYKRTIRACGWEVYKSNETLCYDRDTDFKLEKSCQCFTDACNTGSLSVLPSVAVATSLGFLLYRLR